MYTVIQWPEIQNLMNLEGFKDHSYLINDEKGIEDFGSSAYFIQVDWLNTLPLFNNKL
jgi:hypothetical protein